MTDKKKPLQIYLRDDQEKALRVIAERRGYHRRTPLAPQPSPRAKPGQHRPAARW